jgi:hypothetical protein
MFMFNRFKTKKLYRILLLLAAVVPYQLYSQEASQSPAPLPTSDVQFINATSVPEIDLRIRDGRAYEKLRQGSRISGGAFSIVNWAVEMTPSVGATEESLVKLAFSLPNQASSTVVLAGDFVKAKDDLGKETLRAAILPLPNNLGAGESANRLVFVNGLKQPVKIGAPGFKEQEVPSMGVVKISALPQAITFHAVATGKPIDLPIAFVEFQSIVIALFERDGLVDYVAMPQYNHRE